jgi:quaternary ammonium compound-resistance protein SugE
MAWAYLIIAGIFEVVWAIGLKYTQGFTRWFPSLVTIAGMIFSFYFLSLALKALPIGTAYAVWTGIGALGTAVLGIFLFDESHDWMRLFFLFLILTGIVGLKVTSPGS